MLKNMQKSISSSANSTITNHLTMQNIIMYLLFFMVVTCHSFFIDSKDFRKLLQIFPKSLEVDSQKVRAGHLRRRDNDYRNRDQQIYDHHDRYDEETSRGKIRNLKKLSGKYEYNNINEKLHHHSYVECDHPDHYHHHHHTSKYPEDRNEKKYHKHSDEAVINHEKKHYHEKTRSSPQNDKDLDDKHYEKDTQDKQSNPNYKKDYITGVLVAIPKFKNDDDLEGFYKSKQQTLLLQQLLKGDDDDTRHHQQIPEDEEKSYLY